jgi:hypothetical protein
MAGTSLTALVIGTGRSQTARAVRRAQPHSFVHSSTKAPRVDPHTLLLGR